MATITLSPEFFRKEVKNYSNPAFGFWRELFQNSVDAGAKNIKIDISESDNNVRVQFSDDGCGMSEETLESIFFKLGNTTKSGPDSIGGFGKARILVCFAQDSYKIITRDNIVEGSGAEYQINKSVHIPGCTFIINLNLNVLNQTNMDDLKNSLNTFLYCCDLKPRVFINKIEFNKNNYLRHGRTVRHLDWGRLCVNKSYIINQMFIRVNGVCMYSKYVNSDYSVIIEIDPKQSRQILLSNRDGMNYTYSYILDDLIYQINTNKKTLKDTGPKITFYGDNIRKPFKKVIKETVDNIIDKINISPHSPNLEATYASKDIITPNYSMPENYEEYNERANYISDDIVDGMIHYVETDNQKIKTAARLWQAEKIHKESGTGQSRRKLLGQWIIACEYAMKALSELIDIDFKGWNVGFIFSDDTEALNYKNGDIYNLLINPVDKDGKTKYSLRDNISHYELLILASHECAHLVGPHNEEWGIIFTNIQKKIMHKMPEIHKEMIGVE